MAASERTNSIMSDISIHDLEAAINFWRARSPSSGDELKLCEEASALSSRMRC
jgi:hypothetical protein